MSDLTKWYNIKSERELIKTLEYKVLRLESDITKLNKKLKGRDLLIERLKSRYGKLLKRKQTSDSNNSAKYQALLRSRSINKASKLIKDKLNGVDILLSDISVKTNLTPNMVRKIYDKLRSIK